MKRLTLSAVLLILVGSSSLLAAELVAVPGSNVQYPTPIESTVGTKQVKMVLTGTALRKKFFFSIYAIGSYVQEGVQVISADEMATKDVAKQLHLVMERDVTGQQMADAFVEAIRLNHPEPEFQEEIKVLKQYLESFDVRKGEHVWLTHVPGVGLDINIVGKQGIQIQNVKFSVAIWEIYFGKRNLGDSIKNGLVSRLK
ncbi:MAG: chalcone isomerase family protein [Gemmataceae bacterium]